MMRVSQFRLCRCGHTDQTGQALVEVALAMPLLCAFLFLMIELCLGYYSYCMISECARQGTRYAIVHGTTCKTASSASCTASIDDINTYVQNLGWPNLAAGTLKPSTTFPDGSAAIGNRVQVTVSYSFPLNLPYAPQGALAMSSTSVMYIVQ